MATKANAVNRISESNGNGKEAAASVAMTIPQMNESTVEVTIVGESPYCQNKFSQKAANQIAETQRLGDKAKKRTKREPKDFDACYQGAMYKPEGEAWENGAIPATAIKAAMVAACRLCGMTMVSAKQCVFVEADGFDGEEFKPLIKITKGKPFRHDAPMNIAMGGVDIRTRPMWKEGWEAVVRLRFDADQFEVSDVLNLLQRAGQQVGIGEGRHASKKSVGIGWGQFSAKIGEAKMTA